VATHAEAAIAAESTALFTPTLLLPAFRMKEVAKAKGQPAPTPGKPGEVRVNYLLSTGASREVNGFIMYKEMWGKRSSHSVDVLQLSYTLGEHSLGRSLLDGMVARLDHSRSPSVTTKLSEKVSHDVVGTWRTLGFTGIPGGDTFTMQNM
jgi:hypothetical protein